MKYLLLCLFALLTTNILFAQTELSDYYIRHFTSENGLSQNTVKSIARDEYGFIWLATESGLLRFDGISFKQFDKSNTGIRSSRMFDIRREPGSNTLLAISSSGDLLIISKGKAQKITDGSLGVSLSEPIKKINAQSFKWLHGQLWSDSLFFFLDKYRAALLVLRQGITWYTGRNPTGYTPMSFLINSKELFLLDHAIYRIAEGPAGDTLQRITPYGLRNAVFKGDFAAAQKQHRTKDYLIEGCQATGQMFLYAGQHLYLAEPLPDGNISTRLLLSGFDMNRQLISCTYYDSLHQRIFLGSLTNGLYILERKKFHTAVYHGRYEHPTINVIYDQLAFNDSAVYSSNGTILYTNPAVRAGYLNIPGQLNLPYANHVFRSRDGNLWICARNKVFLMDSMAAHVKNEWSIPGPMAVAESEDGRIWIGTEHSGLYILNMQDAPAGFQRKLQTQDHIMSMEWEGKNLLWICTMPHLLRMNINTGVTDTISSLNDIMARSLYIPRQGEVWICTYENGLYLLLNGRLTHFPAVNYPYLKTVHKILEDRNGFFWISTNHGIYQVRRKDLLAYAEGRKQDDPYFFYYGKELGFLTNEFNGGSQYVGTKLRNGFLGFSSMNGVVFFRPSMIKPELPEGIFIIDRLEVDDKEITPHNGLVTLNRRFRTFKITPVSAYMGDPSNLKYEFRLNNDSDWRNTYNGSVILSSLPVGRNNIFIRKKAGFGGENYTTCKLTVYVPPAWWQTQWFYILAGVVLIAFIWLVILLRVRHWKKRNLQLEAAIQRRTQDLKDIIHDLEHSENKLGEQLQFQTKLNEQITHDITTPLKYLSMFTDQILNRADDQNGLARSDMQYVHQDVNRMYEIVQNLGEYMRTRLSKNISSTRFNIHDLVKEKVALFKIAAAAGNSTIENRTDTALFIHHNESLISIVIHNLIDNAVKNTENGKIIITTTIENGTITICISDTGKGMSAAQIQACNDYFRDAQVNRSLLNTGFGFQIIREIAVLQKLEIRVTPNNEKGLDFRVLIPQK